MAEDIGDLREAQTGERERERHFILCFSEKLALEQLKFY